MNTPNCVQCGSSAGIGFHICHSNGLVLHPEVLRESRARANPLDRLTLAEMLKIHGEDPDEIVEDVERLLEESRDEYFKKPLTYRVEFQSVSGLGFQGGMDFRAIEVAGPTDGDLAAALDFINSEIITPLSLIKNEAYLCRLVSVDSDKIRYVWSTGRLYFDGSWKVIAWR